MMATHVNYIGVLVAAIVNMVIGAVWYSPALFAKPWMALTGRDMSQADKSKMPMMYSVTFIMALIQAYVLAIVLGLMQATQISQGIIAGFWVWLGFVVTTTASGYLFEGRPRNLFAINTGYYLVVLVINGAILAALH